MTTFIQRSLLAAAFVFASLQVSRAEVPSGAIAFSFSPTNSPVYDLQGTYTFTHNVIGAGGATYPFTFSLPLNQNSRGGIGGSGYAIVKIAGVDSAVTFSASGAVNNGGTGPTLVNLTVRMSGDVYFSTQVGSRLSSTISYALSVNRTNYSLVGTARGTANLSRFGNGAVRETVSIPSPSGSNGKWTLSLNVIPSRNLGGTGSIRLADGRGVDGAISGTYTAGTELSKITFTPTGADSAGNKVAVSFVVNKGKKTLKSAVGTLYGQKVTY